MRFLRCMRDAWTFDAGMHTVEEHFISENVVN